MLEEPELEPIDVIMDTLDSADFIEKSLYTIYREIPVRRLIVCDGGSKDGTIDILKKFPRVELYEKPEFRTEGKSLEFNLSKVETPWFAFIDSDLELMPGWYDEMRKYQNQYDVLEASRRIMAYHIYREDLKKLEPNSRAYDQCFLMKKEAMQNYRCDDDYLWRQMDFFIRQVVEKSGYKYGKIGTTLHTHNETERIAYASDAEKSYRKLVLEEPRHVIIDKNKAKNVTIQGIKGYVKYVDPDFHLVKNDIVLDFSLRLLDREWVKQNGPAWLERYDKAHSPSFTIKYLIYNLISKNEKLRSFLVKKFYR